MGRDCSKASGNVYFEARKAAAVYDDRLYSREKAAELLRSTRLKTGEIGAECGFADGSYFIKTFREVKHCTPLEYRQRFGLEA